MIGIGIISFHFDYSQESEQIMQRNIICFRSRSADPSPIHSEANNNPAKKFLNKIQI